MAGQDGNPGNPLGLQTPGFNASFAFFLVFMGASDSILLPHGKINWLTCVCVGLVCFVFLICSLRTNIAFFLIFFSLVCAFSCLAAAYWNLALAYENAANIMAAKRAGRLVVVSFLHDTPLQMFLADTCLFARRVAPSHSSHACLAGGSSSPSCLPPWISRSAFRLATFHISSKGRARRRRSRMPSE